MILLEEVKLSDFVNRHFYCQIKIQFHLKKNICLQFYRPLKKHKILKTVFLSL